MEYPSIASLRARCVFCPKPPCVGIAGGADRARRRSTCRKSPLGRGRRNKRRYLSRDHRGYVRGSVQLGDGGALARVEHVREALLPAWLAHHLTQVLDVRALTATRWLRTWTTLFSRKSWVTRPRIWLDSPPASAQELR